MARTLTNEEVEQIVTSINERTYEGMSQDEATTQVLEEITDRELTEEDIDAVLSELPDEYDECDGEDEE